MIAEIGAAYSGLKTAYDIAKGLNATVTQVQINDIKIALQQHIMDAREALDAAREAQTASARRIAELEQEVVGFKNWEADKQRYELADTGQGSLAYRLQEDMDYGEPPHWICPNCYQAGKKSILKHEKLSIGHTDTLVCHPCGLDIVTRGVRHPTGAIGRRR